jgi:hypothetical protein
MYKKKVMKKTFVTQTITCSLMEFEVGDTEPRQLT